MWSPVQALTKDVKIHAYEPNGALLGIFFNVNLDLSLTNISWDPTIKKEWTKLI